MKSTSVAGDCNAANGPGLIAGVVLELVMPPKNAVLFESIRISENAFGPAIERGIGRVGVMEQRDARERIEDA
jgi:hypothetical protein